MGAALAAASIVGLLPAVAELAGGDDFTRSSSSSGAALVTDAGMELVMESVLAAAAATIPPTLELRALGVAQSWWRFQAIVLVGSHVALFAAAYWFFAALLYRDYEVKQKYIQLLFAATFSASCCMFELLLATLAGAVDPVVGALAWKVDHWTLICLSYVALPACFVWTSVRSVCNGSHRLAMASAVISLPLFWY
ncbi:unnamed protein product, partial [Polarella glacialis]